MTTIRDALQMAKKRLINSDTASLDAQVLLCDAIGIERASLLAHPEQELTSSQAEQYEQWIERRAKGEPVAYILGKRAFYDREMLVSPAVLIPRPETELLLEEALNHVQQHPNTTVVDVGTGSGALGITFAAHHPDAQVYATDISPDALAIARQNADAQGVHVQLLEGDLLQPLIDRNIKVDVVMANLPYIATDDLQALDVRHYEPHLALDGGPDGLDLVRRLLAQIPQACNSRCLVLLEIGAEQGAATCQLAESALAPSECRVLKDYAGLDRIVRFRL